MGYLFSTNKEEDNLGLEWLCSLPKKKKKKNPKVGDLELENRGWYQRY